MPRFDLLRRPQPFIALLLVASGWALSHQFGSNGSFTDCHARGGPYVVVASLVGLAITALGGIYAVRAWRVPEESGRSFLALLTALLAGLAAFAIILQVTAGLILPRCAV